mmetsp:Transcript_37764/g.90323  ORF Transcript_37764/g.90323 Transcript_37764/m.90323 type:complete len:207 (+) Transcript_37764:579-1199(+)
MVTSNEDGALQVHHLCSKLKSLASDLLEPTPMLVLHRLVNRELVMCDRENPVNRGLTSAGRRQTYTVPHLPSHVSGVVLQVQHLLTWQNCLAKKGPRSPHPSTVDLNATHATKEAPAQVWVAVGAIGDVHSRWKIHWRTHRAKDEMAIILNKNVIGTKLEVCFGLIPPQSAIDSQRLNFQRRVHEPCLASRNYTMGLSFAGRCGRC